MAQSADGGDHHGQVLGPAAGEHGVDGDLVGGHDEVARGDLPDDFLAPQARAGKHLGYRLLGGRDDGQPVGPPALEIGLDQLGGIVVGVRHDRLSIPQCRVRKVCRARLAA